jgi:Flp pilus assembly protein TadB
MKTLYDHEYGVYILGTGVVMQIVGWLIIRKIVDIKL